MFGLVPFAARKDLARREDPFTQIFDVFNEPFFHSSLAPFASDWGAQSFRVDVKDTGDAYELTAELPGMKKEDVSLSYENSYLTIEAKKEEQKDEKDEGGNYIRRERSTGSMSRSFYIDGIDEAKASAEFKDGVLKVDLPKRSKEAEVSRRIAIK
ncbi:MAG: Hsp20/alpha crystallin family protein [Schwartzia sp.]|nr:Hsp20/alpha crystallin family protein [Schwartzia sp. (in: firmicutes)]